MAAKYRLSEDDWVIRVEDMAFIPPDPRNADRQRYNMWLEEGGEPDPCIPLPMPGESE
jgi:hypothetical protein